MTMIEKVVYPLVLILVLYFLYLNYKYINKQIAEADKQISEADKQIAETEKRIAEKKKHIAEADKAKSSIIKE